MGYVDNFSGECGCAEASADEQAVQVYSIGIGTDQTIRFGVIKRPVMSSVPTSSGKQLTWQQYRQETEPRRKQLRSALKLS